MEEYHFRSFTGKLTSMIFKVFFKMKPLFLVHKNNDSITKRKISHFSKITLFFLILKDNLNLNPIYNFMLYILVILNNFIKSQLKDTVLLDDILSFDHHFIKVDFSL